MIYDTFENIGLYCKEGDALYKAITYARDVALGRELEPFGSYDEAEDAINLKAPETYSSIAMEPGMFVVFFSHDIHRPNCDLNGTRENRKICMKVHV